ncbi:MAG: hypothetical protein NTV48_01505 [Candidatus Vogelbacteria bacterium]|nr:hypothetical protein [Candidatus Vogelbacteria bacterium]
MVFGFGEKAYSRKDYSEAELKTLDASLNRTEAIPAAVTHELLGGFNLSLMESRLKRAEEKLKKLHDQGHEEANALVEEHNSLITNVQKATEALAIFEEEKLGIGKEVVKKEVYFPRASNFKPGTLD